VCICEQQQASCSVGPGCELKSSFIFSGSAIAHFNYIGDSIVGGDTPLIDAAYKGKNDILEFLLNSGADVNFKNKAGLSALDMARKIENSDAIELFLEKTEVSK